MATKLQPGQPTATRKRKTSALRKLATRLSGRGYKVSIERSHRLGVRHLRASKSIGANTLHVQARFRKGRINNLGGHKGVSTNRAIGSRHRSVSAGGIRRDAKGRFA